VSYCVHPVPNQPADYHTDPCMLASPPRRPGKGKAVRRGPAGAAASPNPLWGRSWDVDS
jgi:hypothetical protein